MKAFYLTVAIAAFAVYANAGVVVLDEHNIPWYNCAGKPDGNYEHPSDCTRFISCSGGIASQRDCANCNIDPVRCPAGRTVYNVSVDACLWADETTCGGTPVPTTLPTERPSSESPPTTPDSGLPTTTTEASIELPLPIKEGDLCDAENCTNIGYCHHYFKCNNETSKWELEYCGDDLLWNPHNSDGTDHIHGGNCDIYENLLPKETDKLEKDEQCLRCYWEENGKCNSVYKYQKKGNKYRKIETLTCRGAGLVFVEAMQTCQRCYNTQDEAGNLCCPKP